MTEKQYCLIITNQMMEPQRLATWLEAAGYKVQFTTIISDEFQTECYFEYEFIFVHPACWKLFYLQSLTVKRSFVLVSGLKDCYTEFLEDQVPFHIKEPLRPSQLQRLSRLIAREKGQLQADCIIIKSSWQYYKVPLNQIDFLERNKVNGYTTLHAGAQQLVIFGILTGWERQLHCTDYFERISDNLLIAKKHCNDVKGDYFIYGKQRIRLIRRYIDTRAYESLKKNFPVRHMYLLEQS